MKTDVILLLNGLIMFLVSFGTDYWLFRSYNFDKLIPKLLALNCTVSGWDGSFAWQKVIIVRCTFKIMKRNCPDSQNPNKIYEFCQRRRTLHRYLFSEYGNLYRECNDLLEGPRQLLSDLHLLYRQSCNYYVTSSQKWHRFRKDNIIRITERVNLLLGASAFITMLAAVSLGICTYLKSSTALCTVTSTASCLTLTAVLYLGAVICFLLKVHLTTAYREESTSSSTEKLVDIRLKQLLDEARVTEVGWSFVAAIVCLALTSSAAYFYMASGKSMKDHRKHLLRRRQVQTALMSSCRQEVAMAIRAKMTVI